ncbi:MAG TPA: histidine kinase dimerization/phosphoacceptor domain -containing protein [Beijerinckiaceae bacterium]|nr:histidine kinase dimerization/phosphoacceptor domain -containing protein [Beijerinckiaceae bacterium]
MNAFASNEAARLSAVRRYDILDTPPDGAFDRITRLAATLFGVPISIVSLVDSDRIWFKSHHGLNATEIPRSPGLCASAILDDRPWILNDASRDPHAMANPLVAGEFGLRFYAGVPLRTSDGFNLGTLCVIDYKPRPVTDDEKGVLSDLAAVVMDQIELRLAARRSVSSLQELVLQKETFLREIHHRVKNNLQTISGLVALHAREVGPSAKSHFEDVLRRITSIGRLHEKFYQAADAEAVELVSYASDLAESVIETYGLRDRVSVTAHGACPEIGLEQGTPLALIVAEALSNACKHGFPNGRQGTIAIEGSATPDGSLLLISDDGVGLTPSSPKRNSMGLRLAEIMVRQLGGSFSLAPGANGGARFELRFPQAIR